MPNCNNGRSGRFPSNGNTGNGGSSPFYTGPFPPATPTRRPCRPIDGRDPDWSWNDENSDDAAARRDAYGFFYQTGRLSLEAGGAVPFNGRGCAGHGCRLDCGAITLRRSGAYQASYTVVVPENYTLDADMALALNGDVIPGSGVEIEKDGTGSSMTFSGQAIVDAEAGDRLALVSAAPVDIAAGRGETIATLTLHSL